MNKLKRSQKGAILFVVMMILMLMSILVLMAVQSSKNDMKIGLAQSEQVRAFDQAEAMLSRVRFALEQVPLPPSIANGENGVANTPDNTSTVIWVTKEMTANNGTDNKNVNEPLFFQPDFEWDEKGSKALTCNELAAWLRRNQSTVDLGCTGIFSGDVDKQPRFYIEFVTKQQPVDDIDGLRGAYFYRITILGKGFQSGRSIVQGITGVEYI